MSKVRSVAMGTAELTGQAYQHHPLVDPIYGQNCVYFDITVKEERNSRKSTDWVTIYQCDSGGQAFWLRDETGQLLIEPQGADVYLDLKINLQSGQIFGARGDDVAKQFMESVTGGSGGLFARPRKLEAHIIREGETLYALGYACRLDHDPTLSETMTKFLHLNLTEIARKLKSNPAKMQALDTNGDGHIDAEEWGRGLEKYKYEIEQEHLSQSEIHATEDICLRCSPEGLLILADKSEHKLTNELFLHSLLSVIGGAGLTLICGTYLFARCVAP